MRSVPKRPDMERPQKCAVGLHSADMGWSPCTENGDGSASSACCLRGSGTVTLIENLQAEGRPKAACEAISFAICSLSLLSN